VNTKEDAERLISRADELQEGIEKRSGALVGEDSLIWRRDRLQFHEHALFTDASGERIPEKKGRRAKHWKKKSRPPKSPAPDWLITYCVVVLLRPYRLQVPYDHSRSDAPDLVRSRKLSERRLSQYCGGGPHGNTECCTFFTPFAHAGDYICRHHRRTKQSLILQLGFRYCIRDDTQ
jgi:hypothetical protein